MIFFLVNEYIIHNFLVQTSFLLRHCTLEECYYAKKCRQRHQQEMKYQKTKNLVAMLDFRVEFLPCLAFPIGSLPWSDWQRIAERWAKK